MKTYSTTELNDILTKHEMWLRNHPFGVRADLSDSDLCGADLHGVDLRWADLRDAYLRGADLRGTDLCRAILSDADLCGANLRGASLRYANLYRADLSDTDLQGADLCDANLYDANLSGAGIFNSTNLTYPIACPEKGSFTAFKKTDSADLRESYIVELEISSDAKRCSATSRKCRCSKAKVISITNIDGTEANTDVAYSTYDHEFVYKVGEIVKVDNFDDNRWNECAPGIHFFITRKEAVDYLL